MDESRYTSSRSTKHRRRQTERLLRAFEQQALRDQSDPRTGTSDHDNRKLLLYDTGYHVV